MRRVNIALCLALGVALWLPNGFSASGIPGHASSHTGSVAASHAGPNVHGHGFTSPGFTGHGLGPTGASRNPVLTGSRNPVMLPAWKTTSRPGSMGFPVSAGGGRLNGFGGEPGTIVLLPSGESRSQSSPAPTVNNGDTTNRRHVTGTVVAVRAGTAGGTIQLRLTRDELPVINGKQHPQPNQDVTVHVSDATRFLASGHKGQASLADVHLGETVRVGFDDRLIREVEVLAMSGSGR